MIHIYWGGIPEKHNKVNGLLTNYRYGWDIAEWLKCTAANASVATALGSIPASNIVESKGRQWRSVEKYTYLSTDTHEHKLAHILFLWWTYGIPHPFPVNWLYMTVLSYPVLRIRIRPDPILFICIYLPDMQGPDPKLPYLTSWTRIRNSRFFEEQASRKKNAVIKHHF